MAAELNSVLVKGLKELNFYSDDIPSDGLILTNEDSNNYYERQALEEAEKFGATAVYFRRFPQNKTRHPIPQIYIFDFTGKVDQNIKISEIHKRLWNFGKIPLAFFFEDTQVKIFNCLKDPNFNEQTKEIQTPPFETIKLASNLSRELKKKKAFSAEIFDNGSFWELPGYGKKINRTESAYEKLLDILKALRKKIISAKLLPEETCDKLLVMSILVKYLEERHDDNNETVFPTEFFVNFSKGEDSFTSVLRKKGACLELFDELSKKNRFNGEIFKWHDKKERQELKKANLSYLADFFDGETEVSGQRVLWRMYSFNDLPVEFISNIYEEFLLSNKEQTQRKGVVYTPPFLVEFLLDQVMPLNEPRKKFRVLDPSCGSGVFLVGAFKRLIFWWRSWNNWKKPSFKDLKKILHNSVFGIEIDPKAVKLAVFSLSVALCDQLSPKIIWEKLTFDDLRGKNLMEDDFFKIINKRDEKLKFDLIIGNPPFKSNFSSEGKKYFKSRGPSAIKFPDKQVALAFMEGANLLRKESGKICMILPSGPLLYNPQAFEYRKYLFEQVPINKVIDFTPLEAVLFGSANVPTSAVISGPEANDTISHALIRRSKAAKEKLFFELDHYDSHLFKREEISQFEYLWKCNLMGGGRIKQLVSRFQNSKSLLELIQLNESTKGWIKGGGFQLDSTKGEIDELKELLGKKDLNPVEVKRREKLLKTYKKADYLTGKKFLPANKLDDKGIKWGEIENSIVEHEYFSRPKVPELFQPPLLLIKKGINNNSFQIGFSDQELTYTKRITGIHCPDKDLEELKAIHSRLKKYKHLFVFLTATASGEYLIKRASAIIQKDIFNLPWPEDDDELETNEIESLIIKDILDWQIEYRRKGENSSIMKPVSKKGNLLSEFGKIFCKILNTIYKKFQPGAPIITDSHIFLPISYGDNLFEIENDPQDFLEDIAELSEQYSGTNLRYVRNLRVYHENLIYLIKPNLNKFWTPQIAIRDADDTFLDLVKQGY